jgi:hypothetical protein
MRDRLTGFQLMRVAEFVAYKRMQVARQDERDRPAVLGVCAAVATGWKLARDGLQLGTAQAYGFGGLPFDKRGAVACEALRRLTTEGYVYRACQGASGKDG